MKSLTWYQASQFLIQFFETIDIGKVQKKPGKQVGNDMDGVDMTPASFNPMRRKLQIDIEP